MLIGFTHKTSKIFPKIFCRRFRHCAIIMWNAKCGMLDYTMHQFVRPGKIELINLSARDLKILENHG